LALKQKKINFNFNLKFKGQATQTATQKSKPKGHIMISYNVGSRDMCSKIKDKLKVNITILFIF
jgi:hypothetical protein